MRDAAKFCTRHSFTPDTPVEMADGTTKPIKDVRVGDRVMATDPKTGRTNAEPVLAVIVEDHQDKTLVDITTTDDTHIARPGVVTATDYHLFWDLDQGNWAPAGDLHPGSHLRMPNGHAAVVTAVHAHHEQDIPLRNLTIQNLHTYYVVAGTASVLVHNDDCLPGITSRQERAGDLGQYTDGQATRDPASQWYHEELSNDELLDGVNNAAEGDGILVSRDGTIYGGHHRKDEIVTRVGDGRIHPDTPIRIDVYGGE
ncbi:hypothetical protein GCM10029964_043410 [Kibdelosporangium lantanae]